MFSTFNDRVNRYPLKTKWLRFYVVVYLPVSILISMVYFTAHITIFTDHHGYWALINALLTVGLIFLQVYTSIKLFKLESSAYIVNIILMACSAVHCSVTLLLAGIYEDSDSGLVLCGFYYFLLFVLPNLIYFTNRKSLFYDSGTEPSPCIHINKTSTPLMILGLIFMVLQSLAVVGDNWGNHSLRNIDWDTMSSPGFIYTFSYLLGFFLVGLIGVFLFIIGIGNEKQANKITIWRRNKKGEKSELTEEENTDIRNSSNEGDKKLKHNKESITKMAFYICLSFAALCVGVYFLSDSFKVKETNTAAVSTEYPHISSIKDNTVVYANSRTKTFHSTRYCLYNNSSSEEKMTAKQAKEKGYKPCNHCWTWKNE